jgi:hypothetical protein
VKGAPSKRPDDPRIDRAEAEVARAVGCEGVEQPRHLGERLVGHDPVAVRPKCEAGEQSPQVLPTERRTHRLTRGSIPHNRRRPLVGDAHRLDAALLGDRRVRSLQNELGEAGRVELDQAGERSVG